MESRKNWPTRRTLRKDLNLQSSKWLVEQTLKFSSCQAQGRWEECVMTEHTLHIFLMGRELFILIATKGRKVSLTHFTSKKPEVHRDETARPRPHWSPLGRICQSLECRDSWKVNPSIYSILTQWGGLNTYYLNPEFKVHVYKVPRTLLV